MNPAVFVVLWRILWTTIPMPLCQATKWHGYCSPWHWLGACGGQGKAHEGTSHYLRNDEGEKKPGADPGEDFGGDTQS